MDDKQVNSPSDLRTNHKVERETVKMFSIIKNLFFGSLFTIVSILTVSKVFSVEANHQNMWLAAAVTSCLVALAIWIHFFRKLDLYCNEHPVIALGLEALLLFAVLSSFDDKIMNALVNPSASNMLPLIVVILLSGLAMKGFLGLLNKISNPVVQFDVNNYENVEPIDNNVDSKFVC